MKKRFLFVAFAILICLSISAFGHSGKTDSKGGHRDNISGGYHYHHGMPAHQHPNGVCSYRSSSSAQPQQVKTQKENLPKPKLDAFGKMLSEASSVITQRYETILARLNESRAGMAFVLAVQSSMTFAPLMLVCILCLKVLARQRKPNAPVFERIEIFLDATISGLWPAFYWSCILGWMFFVGVFLSILPEL